jgi:hypothetical protein
MNAFTQIKEMDKIIAEKGKEWFLEISKPFFDIPGIQYITWDPKEDYELDIITSEGITCIFNLLQDPSDIPSHVVEHLENYQNTEEPIRRLASVIAYQLYAYLYKGKVILNHFPPRKYI